MRKTKTHRAGLGSLRVLLDDILLVLREVGGLVGDERVGLGEVLGNLGSRACARAGSDVAHTTATSVDRLQRILGGREGSRGQVLTRSGSTVASRPRTGDIGSPFGRDGLSVSMDGLCMFPIPPLPDDCARYGVSSSPREAVKTHTKASRPRETDLVSDGEDGEEGVTDRSESAMVNEYSGWREEEKEAKRE